MGAYESNLRAEEIEELKSSSNCKPNILKSQASFHLFVSPQSTTEKSVGCTNGSRSWTKMALGQFQPMNSCPFQS